MKIEYLEVENFKVFRQIKVEKIPGFAVFVGRNGAGKSTFFDIFGFLQDCLKQNVSMALERRGGFQEVRSRDQDGDIQFILKFRTDGKSPLISYELRLGADENGVPVVKHERLGFRRGSKGQPWAVLDFQEGVGRAIEGDIKTLEDAKKIKERVEQRLDSPDILAVSALGKLKDFHAVSSLRRLIEDWSVYDLHIDEARNRVRNGAADTLVQTGENLALVAKFLYEKHPERFQKILKKMEERIQGIREVKAEVTLDNYLVLRFQDRAFKTPFTGNYVSDGTMKMFTYLVLLHSPKHPALLCIEEPENQLYPELLGDLAEEFREYSAEGGQVFISTHSPDFLNVVHPKEVFCLFKKDGFTTVRKAAGDANILSLINGGDMLGSLWRQGILMSEAGEP